MGGDSVQCPLEHVQKANYGENSEAIEYGEDCVLPGMLCPAEKLFSSLGHPAWCCDLL